MIHAAILGATGYGGGELLRLLSSHPHVSAISAVSQSQGGKVISEVHAHLRGLVSGRLQDKVDWQALGESEHPVLFAALPHGEFARRYPEFREVWRQHGLTERLTVIDLSGDFRLCTGELFERAYGYAHPCPEFLAEFTYGLSEWGEVSRGVRRIANPGCFATALALAMAPLAQLPASCRPGTIAISAVTGSSGSGASASEGTHHPTRAHDFRAYKPLQHQHVHEVRQCLRARGWEADFSLVTHSAPLVRGIHATLQWSLPETCSAQRIHSCYELAYPEGGFVRVGPQAPRLLSVVGSNFADLQCVIHERHAAVLIALDNLLKGMAGQAIQNMNLALGLAPGVGLRQAPLWPA